MTTLICPVDLYSAIYDGHAYIHAYIHTGPQEGADVADTVNAAHRAAVRTLNVPNVNSSSRDLALATLCFMRVAFLITRFPRRFFRANTLHLSLSSRCLPRFLPWFFGRVGCSTPTTPGGLRRRHVCLLACDLRAFLLSSLFRVRRFPRRRCTTTVATGNNFT